MRKLLVSIVTRDRPAELQECLTAIVRQTLQPTTILIVDNASGPATKQLIESWRSRHQNIETIDTQRNAGSAGGQAAAMHYAVTQNYELLYTMDDDCEPRPDALEEIVKKWESLPTKNDWALNSTVKAKNGGSLSFVLFTAKPYLPEKPRNAFWHVRDIPRENLDGDMLPNWGCFFNGTLLPTRMIATLGYPRQEFFLRGDEYEYLLRLARRHRVGTVLTSIVEHPRDVDPMKSKGANWKLYLNTRNYVVIERAYFRLFRFSIPYLLLRFAYRWLRSVLLKSETDRAIALGIIDGLRNYFGRSLQTFT